MNRTTHIGLLIAALLLTQPAHAGGQREEALSANVRSSLQRGLADTRSDPHRVSQFGGRDGLAD